ncbi:TetR family transcriptional regulator [Nocardioides sp.]|uniref:acyl-CoA-like ligand-binding transcription factor n=1 Tax=Nocardioides sp. TaxID=35761 RepID=UPI0039E6A194
MAQAGRPRATTHDQVREIARWLFREQGYAATSMAQIARAAGISRTSLFTYFPAKGDLIWGELDDALDRMEAAIESQRGSRDVIEALRIVLQEALAFPLEDHDGLAFRWQIIDTNPELLAHVEAKMAEHKSALTDFIAAELGLAVDDILPRLLVETTMAATLVASRHWAAGSPDTPMSDIVLTAIDPVLRGFAPLVRSSAQESRQPSS